MAYLIHLAALLAIYAILVASLQIVVGQAGLFSMSHGAFFGLGAYAAAAIQASFTSEFAVVALLAICATGAASVLFLRALLVLPRDQFAIGTFAVHLLVWSGLQNLTGITGGPLGLTGIARPTLFGWHLDSVLFVVIASISSIACLTLVGRLIRSPLGLALRGLREDPVLMAAFGRDAADLQVRALWVGGGLAGFAGALYAQYMSFVDPTSFTVNTSIVFLTMLLLGGLGPLRGAVAGASIGLLLPEALRYISITAHYTAELRDLLFGCALMGLLYWRPRGLLGTYSLE